MNFKNYLFSRLKILCFVSLIITSALFSQEKIISKKKTTQTVQTNNNGSFSFSTMVVTNCDLYGGINFMIGIKDFKITSYTYKGVNASSLQNVKFPISIKSPQVNITTVLRFKRGNVFIDIPKKFSWVSDGSWGGLDRNWLKKEDQENIYKTFGIIKNNKETFYDLNIELRNIEIDISYYSGKIDDSLNHIKKQIDQKLK